MAIKRVLSSGLAEDLEVWDPMREARSAAGSAGQALAQYYLPARRALLARLMGPLMGSWRRAWVPEADLEETASEFVVSVALPGVEKKDITVTASERLLELKAVRAERRAHAGSSRRTEQAYGSFHRCLRLPDEVQPGGVKASYRDGILKVTLPKARRAQGRTIRVA